MQAGTHHLSSVAQGWAQTSVNATIFRKNSLVTHAQQQYIAIPNFISCLREICCLPIGMAAPGMAR